MVILRRNFPPICQLQGGTEWNDPITWFNKHQNTVELTTFKSELVALQLCKDLIVALCYKLCIFGVLIECPANVFCDNQGVVKNTSIPQSTLVKKHNAINYCVVWEAAAVGSCM
eukprot:15335669-Ditylum_brightwellii.AAC.1